MRPITTIVRAHRAAARRFDPRHRRPRLRRQRRARFNAFGIVSFDPATRSDSLHPHAQGHVGDFAFVPSGDGHRWEIPLGPTTIRDVATVKDGELHEVGERIVAGREPLRIFEMRLKRIGDVDWPAGGAIAPSRSHQ